MAKYTLLQIVQKVLASMDSDEVNSINDTVESSQVADLVEDVFFNMVVNKDIPEHIGLLKVEALSDTDLPNYMKLPARVTEICGVKYDKATDVGAIDYRDVVYLCPEEFLSIVTKRDATADNVQVVLDPNNSIRLIVINDRHPTYWTSFDDEYMVFDSFNSDVDSTLQQHKTMTLARKLPVFSKTDSFVPDIDDNLFPLLINEVKSWAYVEDKQTTHPKAEQGAKRQRSAYQTQRHRISTPNKSSRPDYGRRR